jgi:hypothetical protein
MLIIIKLLCDSFAFFTQLIRDYLIFNLIIVLIIILIILLIMDLYSIAINNAPNC